MKFLKIVAAVAVANVALALLAGFFLFATGTVLSLAGRGDGIEKGSWLVIDIYGEVLAYDPPETIAGEILGDRPETLHRILSNLEKARVDDRIDGVILKISTNNSMGLAMMQEIRGAVSGIRDAGKPVYAFSDWVDRNVLFVASACDSIFVPDIGEVYLAGMGVVRSYLAGSLEMLGIRPNIHRIDEYKSAAEPILRKDMSEESREMTNWILEDMWDMQIGAIAADRGLDESDIVRHMDHVLFTAEEARDAGLIDGVAYWNDLTDRIAGEDDFEWVSQSTYEDVERGDVGLDGSRTIAVVHAQGMIGGRSSRVDPALGVLMGHESVTAALRAAADNDDVEAIVFRVNSNGGESLASNIIGREVERVAARKPVIVSMIDVAASGGYEIAFRASHVIADSMTITGSIGSISGKFNTSGMWNKIGMTFDSVTKGPNALFYSSTTDFTDAQRERFVDNHWDFVNTWMTDIAEKRGMTFEEIERLAHGRVWTGRQAADNGLIDGTGGLDRALEIARDAAGIDHDENVTLVNYPKRRGLMGLLMAREGGSATVDWMLYRYVRGSLAETARMLTAGRMNVWTGSTPE